MPEDNMTLLLKWEERLFEIKYDIMDSYTESTTIRDTEKLLIWLL